MSHNERRQYARLPLKRRVKLMCTRSGRCYAGLTGDYSAGGCNVLLDEVTEESVMPQPGIEVKVAIDWTGHMGIAHADLMPTATVVRSLSFNQQPQVALAFKQHQQLMASA